MEHYFKLDEEILSIENLNSSDKIIYAVIKNLTHFKGYCWATNKQIQDITKINEKSIQRSINKLQLHGYITKWKRKQGKLVYRFITTNDEIIKRDIKNLIEDSKKIEYKEVSIYDWLNSED